MAQACRLIASRMTEHPTPQALQAATWALRAQFFVAGALFATLGVHVPIACATLVAALAGRALAGTATGSVPRPAAR